MTQHTQQSLTLVVGLGSPHGDDQAGWLVADRLQPSATPGARFMKLAKPIELCSHLADCARLILVDAARSGNSYPQVRRLCWPDRSVVWEQCSSSHGVNVGYALQLAERLQSLP